MGSMASTDPKPENSESKPQTHDLRSEKLVDSSPPEKQGSEKLGDSSPSEKQETENLGDSSTVYQDPVDSETVDSETAGDADDEEEGECGFCLFMKGGGCKDTFVAWEECVEAAEKNKEDIVTKCMEVTSALKKCMDDHSDYYQPILAAEKAAEAEVKKELEAEAEKSKEEAEKSKEEEVVTEKK